ncbi:MULTISPECIES: hypothetical protein [unclassified Clostridium]|uniref:hypothetical protein n=1 Tax=unclassified Clostridium TaxID=2614128 RepID=UPI00029728BE|nr:MULTISPECIES: hypothetical protein [unclassified Clostridium]EKQ57617.1 MAG: hypothetical protein A370_00749 [Clostridium sp. Maddingley MBC34-26]
MNKRILIFSEYNIKRKLILIIFFVTLCILPIFILVSQHDILVIWVVFLLELILVRFTIILITDHISLYSDRIETGNVFSKSIILFNEIKKLDLKLIEQSYRWKKWKVISIVFLNSQNYILLTLPVKSTKRLHDIISALESNNNIKLSQNLIEYLNENANHIEGI